MKDNHYFYYFPFSFIQTFKIIKYTADSIYECKWRKSD